MDTLVADLLRSRVREAGADPLVTYYDVDRGERVELSAVTFANWVAKAANLLSFDISVAAGDAVALPLARTSPGHWMTAVWEVAIWQVGAYVDLAFDPAEHPDVLVCGPDWRGYADTAVDVLACSLHPFATGLGPGLSAWVTDVDLAVRAQPDNYVSMPVDPTALAWVDADRRLTQFELVAGPAEPERRLIVPGEAWTTVRAGLIAALGSGGSVVVVVGGTPRDQAEIGSAERVVVGD